MTTVDGIKFASEFWEILGTRFSMIFGIICIPGGHQDLPPGFYQVFTLIYLGISRIQRGKPTRNLLEKNKKIQKILLRFLTIPFFSYFYLRNFFHEPQHMVFGTLPVERLRNTIRGHCLARLQEWTYWILSLDVCKPLVGDKAEQKHRKNMQNLLQISVQTS